MHDGNVDSDDLKIQLKSKDETELFKWFLASLLFGKPIQQQVVKRTYFEFEKEGLVTPQAILDAGWDRLVKVLDRGHYVRYDESTATKLLEIMEKLKNEYGSVLELVKESGNRSTLSQRLQEFKGIGPKTAEIFIDELERKGWSV
ncbi:MAG: DNA methylase [Patescibacteria group bacterium]|jgi:endonuclease III